MAIKEDSSDIVKDSDDYSKANTSKMNEAQSEFKANRLDRRERLKQTQYLIQKRREEDRLKKEREVHEKEEKESLIKDNKLKDKVVKVHYFKKPKERETVERERQNSDEREITIKIKPRKIIQVALIILILLVVFYLGRFSAGDSSGDSWSGFDLNWNFSSSGDDDTMAKVESDKVVDTSPEGVSESAETSDSDETKSADESSDAADESSTEDSEDTALDSDTADETADVAADSTESTGATLEEQGFTTTYDDVSIVLDSIEHEWKGTWGKITTVSFTIKNKENGPVKMDHLGMTVEGYGEFEKVLPISASVQQVQKMTQVSSKVGVPSGFGYKAVAAGDLSNVQITIVLYDAESGKMGTATKEFNLGG